MIINLAENKNPYLPTKKMLDEIKRWIPEISHYPPIDDSILCNKMGEFFHIDSNCIVFLNGSMEGINYLTKYFFKKRMTLFVPTFWGYKYCANKFNVNVTEIPLENCLHYSLDDIDYYAKKSDFIFLCNPNNPTLDILPSKKLISIIFNNPNCHFIIDETMLCFSKFFSDTTMISEISKMKNLSVLLSYSKVLGIAGLRSGVLFTNKNIAEWIKKERSPFCMNKITYKFLSKYLFTPLKMESILLRIDNNYRYLIEQLSKEKAIKNIFGKDSNFLLIEFQSYIDVNDLTLYLLSRGIEIRNLKQAYPDLKGEWIRISAGTKKEYIILVRELKKYLSS